MSRILIAALGTLAFVLIAGYFALRMLICAGAHGC